jgi:DNA-3-methyladenine glycosylase
MGQPPAGGAAIDEPRPGSSAAGRPVSDPLPAGFYARPVLEVARDLIGCVVEHRPAGGGEPLTSGVIVETEAYHDSEPACHAFVGLTPRTRILFGPPGRAYLYRSYGIHALLNAVCEPEGVGAAVLIRALEPLAGIAAMRARRSTGGVGTGTGQGTPMRDEELCSGPGKLTQALGIELSENGTDLACGSVRIRPREADRSEIGQHEPRILTSARIGITKAVELPWRFSIAGNRHVSRPRPSEK